MELLVATTNPGKFQELGALLKDLPLQIVSLTDLLDPPRVIEDGLTFEENALKKARALANFSGLLTLAEDSGLEVDVLNGAPGIYSARYAGAECNDNKNNQKLLSELQSVTEDDRTARFVCALALCSPGLKAMPDWTVREVCEGRIAFSLQGKHGFGYDPLFFFPPMGKTFGEIGRETKALVSHRGKALKRLAVKLCDLLGISE
jgi:XTP/dITP diphosphohydrolase